MHENEIATLVLDVCFNIHRNLGPGLFDSVYEGVLTYEFLKMNLKTDHQKSISVIWDSIKLDHGFRADLTVEDKVIIEVKSIEKIAAVHQKQLLTYLRLTGLKPGLLINFNEALLKDGIQRIVNKL